MTISAETFLSDTIIFLRDLLRKNITDPLGRKDSIGFIMTAYAKRNTQYPLITVMNSGLDTQKLGMQSEKHWTTLTFEFQVYARDSKEVDRLTQQVINTLKDNQYGYESTDVEEIHGFQVTSVVPIIEVDGDNTIHRKVITVVYKVII